LLVRRASGDDLDTEDEDTLVALDDECKLVINECNALLKFTSLPYQPSVPQHHTTFIVRVNGGGVGTYRFGGKNMIKYTRCMTYQ
jgi:hypothetical protein